MKKFLNKIKNSKIGIIIILSIFILQLLMIIGVYLPHIEYFEIYFQLNCKIYRYLLNH